jgi:RNA polymerase sigma-70 factor, ECF subfamily
MSEYASTRSNTFQTLRPELIALAYRMLGDLARAEDVLQEAWLRWQGVDAEVASPKAYLSTIVTRLCLNELSSARARREESRGDRLPEPVDLEAGGLTRVEQLDQISMAFLVVLQRLTPAERAVFLLHDVFELEHAQIATFIDRSAAACRKLLERARNSLAIGRKLLSASQEEHQRLLRAFMQAATTDDATALANLLAEDAMFISDGGPDGRRVAGFRNLKRPLQGPRQIAAFVAAATRRGSVGLEPREHVLNGQPAIIFWRGDEPFAALLLAVADGKIKHIYFHADLARLGHVGPRDRSLS